MTDSRGIAPHSAALMGELLAQYSFSRTTYHGLPEKATPGQKKIFGLAFS